jgi:DNA polymerase III epsilon subunit-like protein
MKKITPSHVMIDLETLGTEPGCCVISIGAVAFDPRGNILTKNTFYSELDYIDQQDMGLTVCPETRKWWQEQSPQAQEALQGIEDLGDALKELAEWLPDDCKVWGNGATFDISILEHCYRVYNIEIPWKFWNIRDCRTVKDMYESHRGGWDKKAGGTKHNALDDAIHQAKYINKMWKSLVGGE